MRNNTFVERNAPAPSLCFRFAVAMLSAAALSFAGAAAGRVSPGFRPSVTHTPRPAFPVSAVDALSHRITLRQAPRRIVSLGPSATEILFDIGAGGRVVADTTFDDYPAAAKRLPKVGNFIDPSSEKILSFHPDLVVAVRGNSAALLSTLRSLHVPVFALDPRRVADVIRNVRELGLLTGTSAGAERVAAGMERSLRETRAAIGRERSRRPTCLIEVWNSPLMVVGPGTFPADALALAGGNNIAPASATGYPQLSSESVIALRPQCLFLTEPQQTPASVRSRPGWALVPAVKTGRVYNLNPDLLNRPAPRIVLAVRQIAADLYPHAFRH